MRHPLDRDFATPRFHEYAQAARAESEGGLVRPDSLYRPLKLVTGYSESRLRKFIGDPDFAQPESDAVGVGER